MTSLPDPSLIDAVKNGEIDIVAQHLSNGVDADTADGVGRSALYHAAFNGDKDIVKLLLGHKADANMTDDDGATPLIASLEHAHFEVAALLLAAGADINMVSGEQQQTPLHWAFNMDLRVEKTSRVIWLIDQGADASRKNGTGRSVLDRARDYERKWPFAGEILGHMEESIKRRDPAFIKAREMRAAKEEMCAAIHGGLEDNISVRPLRLVPPAKKL